MVRYYHYDRFKDYIFYIKDGPRGCGRGKDAPIWVDVEYACKPITFFDLEHIPYNNLTAPHIKNIIKQILHKD